MSPSPGITGRTSSGSAPPEPEIRITEPLCAVFRRKLKSVGLKYTTERARILDAVIAMTAPFQIEELIEKLRAAAKTGSIRVSKATVYRTIKLLQEAGIVQQILLDSDHSHYQLAYGRASTALVVRLDTHLTQQVDVPELSAIADRLCRTLGLKPEGQRLVIYARQ